MNKHRFFAKRNFADLIAFGDEVLCSGQLCAAIVMNCDQGFAFFYAVADAFVEFEANGVVDSVFFFFATAAKTKHSSASRQ